MTPIKKLDQEILVQLLVARESLAHLIHVKNAIDDSIVRTLLEVSGLVIPTGKNAQVVMFTFDAPEVTWVLRVYYSTTKRTDYPFKADLTEGLAGRTR